METIDELIALLNSQIVRLPSAEPDAVESMLAELSTKLETLAQDVRENKVVDRESLHQAQVLLGVYAQQLGRAMGRVRRGLEVFGLDEPVYSAGHPGNPGSGNPVSVLRRSLSA